MTAGVFGDQPSGAYNRRDRTAVYWEADAALCDPVPGDRPGRDLVRPPRDPLVRARLYCRAADRLAVLPRACQPAAISGRPAECRRLSGVGYTRRRPRRTPRLCPVLHAGLLRISPAGGTLCLAWRD